MRLLKWIFQSQSKENEFTLAHPNHSIRKKPGFSLKIPQHKPTVEMWTTKTSSSLLVNIRCFCQLELDLDYAPTRFPYKTSFSRLSCLMHDTLMNLLHLFHFLVHIGWRDTYFTSTVLLHRTTVCSMFLFLFHFISRVLFICHHLTPNYNMFIINWIDSLL